MHIELTTFGYKLGTPIFDPACIFDVRKLPNPMSKIRGDTEGYFTFKLSHEKSCVWESLVSAEVSQHALASMIEKQHTQTSFTIHWQSIISSA